LGFDYFSLLLLTIFKLNCYFVSQREICDIAAHRPIFAPALPSPANMYFNRAAKKIGEKPFCSNNCTLHPLTFFQLNCYLLGYRMIRDIPAHSWMFGPPPQLTTLVYLHRFATKKEW